MPEDKKKFTSGTMFHTNYYKQTRNIRCDDDCEPQGCPGHVIELRVNSTSGVGCIVKDGKDQLWLDCNEAQAIYEMMNFLLKN